MRARGGSEFIFVRRQDVFLDLFWSWSTGGIGVEDPVKLSKKESEDTCRKERLKGKKVSLYLIDTRKILFYLGSLISG